VIRLLVDYIVVEDDAIIIHHIVPINQNERLSFKHYSLRTILICALGGPVLVSMVTSFSLEGVPIMISDMVLRSDRFYYQLHVVTDQP
jgi:hypothetical protein